MALVTCEFCGGAFAPNGIDQHRTACSREPVLRPSQGNPVERPVPDYCPRCGLVAYDCGHPWHSR